MGFLCLSVLYGTELGYDSGCLSVLGLHAEIQATALAVVALVCRPPAERRHPQGVRAEMMPLAQGMACTVHPRVHTVAFL